jgi:Zn-dependent protease with chaperone function
MTRDEFDTLVNKLDWQARSTPRLYRGKILLLALLGNVYAAGALVAIAGFMVAAVFTLKGLAVKVLLVCGVLMGRVLKSLWVKVEPPQGTETTPARSPELFAMIEDLQRQLRAPRFHRVLVTADHNAGVVQVPRFGLFGGTRNYLLIGFPLMKTLGVEQFRAVLAHEFGHLARGHGSFGNWIYRQRLRWAQLLGSLERQPHHGDFLFKPFYRWFSQYFSAYTFPLARANEYEADATAVRLTSPQVLAEALTGSNVIDCYLSERYWPQIHRRADDLPRPDLTPFRSMDQHVCSNVDGDSAKEWLDRAVAARTDTHNTHPSLTDRLHAVGAQPLLAPPAAGESADRLLGAAGPELADSFDRDWQSAILPSWEERHRKAREDRATIAELDAKVESGAELGLEEAFRRALLTESVHDQADAALEQLRLVHTRAPENPLHCLALGTRLLNRDDDAGIEILKGALKDDDRIAIQVAEAVRDYNWRHGRKQEAESWHEYLLNRAKPLQAAEKERNELLPANRFLSHGLEEKEFADFKAQVAAVKGIRCAYLVRKDVKHYPERVCYVLAYRVTPWYGISREPRNVAIQQAVHQQVKFPGETMIVRVDGNLSHFEKKMKKVKGSRVK